MSEEFYRGAKVRHKSQPAWGIGTIKEVRGNGRLAVIDFAYAGPKKILLDESYLEVVRVVPETPVERAPVRVVQPAPPTPPRSPDEQLKALFAQTVNHPTSRSQIKPVLSTLAQLYRGRKTDEEKHGQALLERWSPYAHKEPANPTVDESDWDELARKLLAHMIRHVGWEAVAGASWDYPNKTLDLIRLFALSDQKEDSFVEIVLRVGRQSSLSPRAVILALAHTGSPKALFFLRRVLRHHEDASVREEALQAIKYFETRSAEDRSIQSILSSAFEASETSFGDLSSFLLVLLSYDLSEQHRAITWLKERQPALLTDLVQECTREIYRVAGETAAKADEHVTVLLESLFDFILVNGEDTQSTAYRQAVEYLKRIKDPDREAILISHLPESAALEYFQYIFSATRLVTRERRSSGLMLLLDRFPHLLPRLQAPLTKLASEERSPGLRQRLTEVLGTIDRTDTIF